MNRRARSFRLLLFVISLAVAPLQNATAGPPSSPQTIGDLHNVIDTGYGVLSGSVPESGEDYDTLVKLGVKTVICVEADARGAELAKGRGLRHVHIPISYGGIPPQAGLDLARAVQVLPKPIYIHCQQGVHRSPAATGLALVSLGHLTNQQGIELLHAAGTSTHYRGLYAATEKAEKLSASILDSIGTDFPERVQPRDLSAQMAAIGRAWHHLEELKAAGWKAPPDHPDLDPVGEAEWIRGILEQIAADTSIMDPKAWLERRAETTAAASHLIDALEKAEADLVDERFGVLHRSCIACHERFRD